jgi:hypothetical protein
MFARTSTADLPFSSADAAAPVDPYVTVAAKTLA